MAASCGVCTARRQEREGGFAPHLRGGRDALYLGPLPKFHYEPRKGIIWFNGCNFLKGCTVRTGNLIVLLFSLYCSAIPPEHSYPHTHTPNILNTISCGLGTKPRPSPLNSFTSNALHLNSDPLQVPSCSGPGQSHHDIDIVGLASFSIGSVGFSGPGAQVLLCSGSGSRCARASRTSCTTGVQEGQKVETRKKHEGPSTKSNVLDGREQLPYFCRYN